MEPSVAIFKAYISHRLLIRDNKTRVCSTPVYTYQMRDKSPDITNSVIYLIPDITYSRYHNILLNITVTVWL